MEHRQLISLISKIILAVEKRIPQYLADEADRNINEGNSAVCIIDAAGEVHGKMFGPDKIRQRNSFRIAWIKASQVWITGLKTGEFEKRVYAGEIDEGSYGISRPDFIGWEGGQPIVIDTQTKLSAGFSGFRGTSDLEIVNEAVSEATGRK
jgi:glc operon protein GlcG